MPGRADFRDQPTETRLHAACRALAHLHRAWAEAGGMVGPCPAVRQRLDCARDWRALVASGWQPAWTSAPDDPVAPWARRAWELLPAHIGRVKDMLATWAARSVRLQPCLCDVWHDHVLFQGDRVSGLVDYGGVKLNHVAADLARLLGSLVGDDAKGWQAGMGAYREVSALSAEEEEWSKQLDRTGVILGAANWLSWLYHQRKDFADRPAVARRLAELVLRMEGW